MRKSIGCAVMSHYHFFVFQATQFYQNASGYGASQPRSLLPTAQKSNISSNYSSFGSVLGQTYNNPHSSQTQSYSQRDTDRTFAGRSSSTSENYGNTYNGGPTNYGTYGEHVVLFVLVLSFIKTLKFDVCSFTHQIKCAMMYYICQSPDCDCLQSLMSIPIC